MKIIGISDIHGKLIDIPKCDVLCIAGDVVPLPIQRNSYESEKWFKNMFVDWANKINCGKIFLVPGNHDFYLYELYQDTEKYQEFINQIFTLTLSKVEILVNVLTEYRGVKFFGCPFIQPVEFQEGRWAFEYTGTGSYDIPYCDILITHDSPFHNRILEWNGFNKYKYWLFGHWHDDNQVREKFKFNCSILDNTYSLNNRPLVEIEFNTMEETKYELLQDFTEEIKKVVLPHITDNLKAKVTADIDAVLVKFLDNPKDLEDGINWDKYDKDIDEEYEESYNDLDTGEDRDDD